jgi:hypothetical protein
VEVAQNHVEYGLHQLVIFGICRALFRDSLEIGPSLTQVRPILIGRSVRLGFLLFQRHPVPPSAWDYRSLRSRSLRRHSDRHAAIVQAIEISISVQMIARTQNSRQYRPAVSIVIQFML